MLVEENLLSYKFLYFICILSATQTCVTTCNASPFASLHWRGAPPPLSLLVQEANGQDMLTVGTIQYVAVTRKSTSKLYLNLTNTQGCLSPYVTQHFPLIWSAFNKHFSNSGASVGTEHLSFRRKAYLLMPYPFHPFIALSITTPTPSVRAP